MIDTQRPAAHQPLKAQEALTHNARPGNNTGGAQAMHVIRIRVQNRWIYIPTWNGYDDLKSGWEEAEMGGFL
jgi:hypothetical protein